MIAEAQALFYSQRHFFPVHTLSFYLLLTAMVQTRSQFEKLLKDKLIDKVLSLENFKNDFDLKFSELNFRFNDFEAKYEMMNFKLWISRRYNELLFQCITQLERNNMNKAQYNRRKTLIIPRMFWNNLCANPVDTGSNLLLCEK